MLASETWTFDFTILQGSFCDFGQVMW